MHLEVAKFWRYHYCEQTSIKEKLPKLAAVKTSYGEYKASLCFSGRAVCRKYDGRIEGGTSEWLTVGCSLNRTVRGGFIYKLLKQLSIFRCSRRLTRFSCLADVSWEKYQADRSAAFFFFIKVVLQFFHIICLPAFVIKNQKRVILKQVSEYFSVFDRLTLQLLTC